LQKKKADEADAEEVRSSWFKKPMKKNKRNLVFHGGDRESDTDGESSDFELS
jgi:hypothetical protein